MYLLFHLDTKDSYELYSLYGILQTTSSKFYALLRLRIALILQCRYQRWPCTKQPSWNSSNNIVHTICPLGQKLDGRHQPNKPTAYIITL